MTTDKARKRAVRTRMDKTGERYAAARRHVARPDRATASEAIEREVALPARVAEPTMSEATIAKGTGRAWDDWFRVLDAWGATDHTHTEIATWLRDQQGVPGWWAQSVTVGYEYARGMRSRPDGGRRVDVSVRKTIHADPMRVWNAWVDAATRDTWLSPGTLTPRAGTGSAGKSARFDAADGRLVHIYLGADGERTTTVVTCEGLAGPEEVESQRQLWRVRLADLERVLRREPAGATVAAEAAQPS